MELSSSLYGAFAGEGDLYFFSSDCPVGLADHIHVCIRHCDRILLLSACSSQIDTAMRIAVLRGYDMNTFPVFLQDEENKFRKPQTYINCNNILELTEQEFGNLVKTGKIHLLNGKINENGLKLIAKGVQLSPDTTNVVKKMMEKYISD